MDSLIGPLGLAFTGFAGGLLLGLAARRGRFCTLGAIEDALYANDLGRVRMWTLALASAIFGTFALSYLGLVDLEHSIYASVAWNPVAGILGGLIFGYGMAIAGNCGYGALARLGGGDLRSFVIVIVMGISAYMTIGGPIGVIRARLFAEEPRAKDTDVGYAHLLGTELGIDPLGPAILIAALLAGWAFWSPDFRNSFRQVFWSVIVGLAIVSGWLGTSMISRESFDVVQVESHSFTAPVGETILYLMTASGGGLSFAIGSVAGVILGAVIGSISKGHFRWEACDDPQELGRQILGGFLMGVGGVLALGCSLGQGLTAFSTLAYSAPVVLASIFLGASLGLRQLIQGFRLLN